MRTGVTHPTGENTRQTDVAIPTTDATPGIAPQPTPAPATTAETATPAGHAKETPTEDHNAIPNKNATGPETNTLVLNPPAAGTIGTHRTDNATNQETNPLTATDASPQTETVTSPQNGHGSRQKICVWNAGMPTTTAAPTEATTTNQENKVGRESTAHLVSTGMP